MCGTARVIPTATAFLPPAPWTRSLRREPAPWDSEARDPLSPTAVLVPCLSYPHTWPSTSQAPIQLLKRVSLKLQVELQRQLQGCLTEVCLASDSLASGLTGPFSENAHWRMTIFLGLVFPHRGWEAVYPRGLYPKASGLKGEPGQEFSPKCREGQV